MDRLTNLEGQLNGVEEIKMDDLETGLKAVGWQLTTGLAAISDQLKTGLQEIGWRLTVLENRAA